MLSRETKNYYRLKAEEIKRKVEVGRLTKIRNDHREACKYDPLELICSAHNVKFVKFKCTVYSNFAKSHGCPVCVGLIRAKVQLELHRKNLSTKIRNGRIIHGPKRGRPKI